MIKRSIPSSWNILFSWFDRAFRELALDVTLPELERWTIDLYTAMSGPLRRFHTLDHLFRFEPRDAIETLAVLYHDTVYWSVDGSWPPAFADALCDLATDGTPEGVLAHADLPHYAEVLAVFDRRPGDKLGSGSNELLSALVLAHTLGARLGREATLAAAACIEATIPFRGSSARPALHARLTKLGLPADALVIRATHLANQDVGDFRLDDVGAFLSGTWNLLPELNPQLRITAVFTIQAYRRALEAMRKFFGFLKPDLLFESWGSEPEPALLARWKAQAETNLEVARRYLGAKLLAASLLEACARETGSDVPLSLFMGAASDRPEDRLEGLLPSLTGSFEVDPVYALLEGGRSGTSSFDLTNSPLAAWIYRQLTSAERQSFEALAAQLFSGTLSPRVFLLAWPPALRTALVEALAAFVPTRRVALEDLTSMH